VLANLAVNARDAMASAGRLSVLTGNVVLNGDAPALGLPPGEYVRLVVADTGSGMDAETRTRALEPFFTTKEEGRGTGLGLSTIHGIVSGAGGGVLIESEPGYGTEIVVYLPRTHETVDEQAESTPPARPVGGSARILLVEDEPVVRRLFDTVLDRLGYDVVAVECGEDAVEAVVTSDAAFDLVVTDFVMPGMSGRDLVEQLGQLGYTPRVLFVSGYVPGAGIEDGLESARSAFMQKPFTADELAVRVRSLLDAAEAA
jgi:two-component system, cell cycle sensor histidine kinase and response regulator CckA